MICFHGDGDVLYLRGSKTGADALAQLADQGDVYTAERTQARGARACVRSLTEGDGVAWKVERRRLTTEVEWRDLFFYLAVRLVMGPGGARDGGWTEG